jgi:NAD(P)-dependent dehydrogenase (short-subunit alcohol dehydrogenase family)
MDVNVLGSFLCARECLKPMRERGGGRILNVASGTPFKGVPFLLHYVTSKGAIVAMTRALAKELGGAGILVNAIAPGFTLSEGVKANPIQLEKLQEVSLKARTILRDQVPEDVVGAAAFLVGPDANFITGQTIVVDGGAYFH